MPVVRKQLNFSDAPEDDEVDAEAEAEAKEANAKANAVTKNDTTLLKVFDENEMLSDEADSASTSDAPPQATGEPSTSSSTSTSASKSTKSMDSAFRTALNIGNMTALKLIINEDPQIISETFEVRVCVRLVLCTLCVPSVTGWDRRELMCLVRVSERRTHSTP